MNLTEKSAYIKGLIEGINPSESEEQTKILNAIVNLLEDITLTIKDLEETCGDFGRSICEMDEDLKDIEDLLFGDESICGCDDCDDCSNCGDLDNDMSCENCEEIISLDDEVLDD